MLQEKIGFPRDMLGSIDAVLLQCPYKGVEAFAHIVKVDNRFMQRGGGEIGELLHKKAKGLSCFQGLSGGFHRLIGANVFHIDVSTPVVALIVLVEAVTISGRNQMSTLRVMSVSSAATSFWRICRVTRSTLSITSRGLVKTLPLIF